MRAGPNTSSSRSSRYVDNFKRSWAIQTSTSRSLAIAQIFALRRCTVLVNEAEKQRVDIRQKAPRAVAIEERKFPTYAAPTKKLGAERHNVCNFCLLGP